MYRSVSRRLSSPSNRLSILTALFCSLKPRANTDIGAPGVREIWQVGKLPRHFEAEGDALVSTHHVDAAAQADADGTATNQGNLEDGRIVEAANAEGAEPVRRQDHGRDGSGHREGSTKLAAQGAAFVNGKRAARVGGDGLRAVEEELFGHQ